MYREFHESGVEDGRFRFVVDMSGFHSSQIKLKLKGRKLMVSFFNAKSKNKKISFNSLMYNLG